MTNERGFGLVSFLTLMPFLISIMTLMAGAAFLFKADAHLKHECRVSVLKSQHEVAEKLEKLMALNKEASALRSESEDARLALEEAEATGLPPPIAAAEMWVASVKARQTLLAVQQKALIATAMYTTSVRAAIEARQAVMKAIQSESLANLRTDPPSRMGFPRLATFKVVAEPKGDLTPDYYPAENFTNSQTVDVDMKVSLKDLLPEWLKKLLPTDDLEISSHCQATLIKEEGTEKWVETLNAVR